MYRSEMTTAPRSRAGRTTVSMCSARSAAYSSASARCDRPSLDTSSRIDRSRLPTGVAPGSRVSTTSWPLPRIHSASASACVDLPAPSPPSRAMKKPEAAGACSGSSPRSSASRRSCRSGTPDRSSTLASTSAATGSSRAPASISVKAAPPCAKTNLPLSSRCGPIPAATSGAITAPSATQTRTTACRCSVVRDRRYSSVSWSSSVCPMLAAMPAPIPARARISSTVVTSGTSPAASSATPVKAMTSASSRRRDRAGSRAGAVRMPTTTPPVSTPTNRPYSTGPPPRSLACSTATATAADTAAATAAQASTSSGIAPVRPLSGPAVVFGRRSPSSGDRARGVRVAGSSRKVSTERDAANSPAATYEARAAWCWPNQSMPTPSRLLNRAATTSATAASGIATNPVRSESRRRASRWSGSGRTVAPSGGGAGSSAGAALSRHTVQKRSATPVTKAVTRSMASASSGIQSIHSGATMSSAARSPSAPTMVQRRSSGPSWEVSAVSGPRSTAPKRSVARMRTAKTVATANATPR